MVTIGAHIQSLRKEHRVTQTELANAVGVSTQAVSKWECGGTPDAELLPSIADFFHVSIDALYGRKQGPQQKLSSYVYEQVKPLPTKERNLECFRIIYSLLNACSEVESIGSTVMKPDEMEIFEDDTMRFGYLMATNSTIGIMSLTTRIPYAMFFPEPEEGYLDTLLPVEEYVALFQFLSKPHRLEVLFQLYQRTKGFTQAMLTKLMNIETAELTEILEEMQQRQWIVAMNIDTEDETIVVYCINPNTTILPFLISAMDIDGRINVGYSVLTREKPLLYHNNHKK